MIPLKSEKDLEMMRCTGQKLARIIKKLREYIEPSITTLEIDRVADNLIRQENAESAFLGYKGFPAHICTSVNEEVVHGIPSERRLKDCDIVSVDVGINYQGYFADAAITIGIGKVSPSVKKLIEVTKEALMAGVRQARVNNHLYDISHAIQQHVENNGFSVVREFVGHGIGRSLHEEPEIPNFGRPHEGVMLMHGMVLAIEPMVNTGSWECQILDNGWTAVTKDRLFSAHFEHTVAIGDSGPEILTHYN
ncbi:MAG: type I methionyl aminopeptidase [Candidatus Omnitrophota bacterium]|nr:MAG: type I methionyl aminopeptidase [Candidatus Omnitrophota bacterium]